MKASRPFLPKGQVVKPQRSPNEPIFKKQKQKDYRHRSQHHVPVLAHSSLTGWACPYLLTSLFTCKTKVPAQGFRERRACLSHRRQCPGCSRSCRNSHSLPPHPFRNSRRRGCRTDFKGDCEKSTVIKQYHHLQSWLAYFSVSQNYWYTTDPLTLALKTTRFLHKTVPTT